MDCGLWGRIKPQFTLLLAGLLLPVLSSAQAPDVRAKVDFSLAVDYTRENDRSLRLYNPLGRPSIAALSLATEAGYNVYVAERLQRLPRDFDEDLFDEAYVEDPGILRAGKQYLPFGTGRLLHESVLGLRLDSNLIAESAPVSLVACNAGSGRQNGVVLRVGRSVGVSFAQGQHFGIAATSLDVVRRPEDAPGRYGGWSTALGADATRRFGKVGLSGEALALSGGSPSLSVLDAEATFVADNYRTFGVGVSHAQTNQGSGPQGDTLRLFGRLHAARNSDLEPLVRFRNGNLYDASITLRVRL